MFSNLSLGLRERGGTKIYTPPICAGFATELESEGCCAKGLQRHDPVKASAKIEWLSSQCRSAGALLSNDMSCSPTPSCNRCPA